jgi:signal transduction histidine kinase
VIQLAAEEGQGVLTITDNGSGISDLSANNGGMGRHLMSYRARVIGGSLEIQRVPAGGTAVICLFPVHVPAQKPMNIAGDLRGSEA